MYFWGCELVPEPLSGILFAGGVGNVMKCRELSKQISLVAKERRRRGVLRYSGQNQVSGKSSVNSQLQEQYIYGNTGVTDA